MCGIFKEPINGTLKSKMAENLPLKNRYGGIFSVQGSLTWMNFADWSRMISKQTAVICSKSEPEIKFQYSGHLGEFKYISSKKLMPVMRTLICGLMGTGVKVKVCCWKCHIWNHLQWIVYSLCNFYGRTLMIKGTLLLSTPLLNVFSQKKL